MRGRSASVLALAVIAFALTFAAVSGQAAAMKFVYLHARASHGYQFGLSVAARPGPGMAGAGLGRELDGNGAAVAYYTKRRAGGFAGGRLHADFGPYGSTSAKFVKKVTHRKTTAIGPRGCKIVEVRKFGVFRGGINFEGENGFSEIHASTARGVIDEFRISKACHGRVEAPERRTPLERYEPRPSPAYVLNTCGPDPSTYLAAGRKHDAAYFEAGSSERVGGIGIWRFAYGLGPLSGFKLGEQGTRAMVRPGIEAFEGTGRFANRRLKGNLAVDLPGRDATALTPGKGFLKPARKVRKDLPCFPFVLGD